MDVLSNGLFHLGTCREVRPVQAFGFQGTEEVLHRRVVVKATGGWILREQRGMLESGRSMPWMCIGPSVTVEATSASDLFLFECLADRVRNQRRRHISANLRSYTTCIRNCTISFFCLAPSLAASLRGHPLGWDISSAAILRSFQFCRLISCSTCLSLSHSFLRSLASFHPVLFALGLHLSDPSPLYPFLPCKNLLS